MSSTEFDLVVLGTGPSGGTVARQIAERGQRVAIVDAREFGGVCALRGCNPKKVYVNAGAVVDQVRRAQGSLLSQGEASIDWSQLHQFKRQFTQPVLDSSEDKYRDAGIATYHGAAEFLSPSRLRIEDAELQAKRVLIATGAKPVPLGIDGEQHILHSDDFLGLSELPERILFIGGGYVSMEFAHVVARCGRTVAVVQNDSRILTGFDADMVESLTRYSREQGIRFHLDASVTAVERQDGGGLRAVLSDGQSIATDMVIHGAGRVPNIDKLNLDAGEVEFGKQGVAVDQYLRSVSNPRVYATGDCADSDVPRLTPVANEEARAVVVNLAADEPHAVADYGVVPSVAFTTPSIASIGLSEAEARKQCDKLRVHADDMSSWGSVRKTGGTVAAYKILIDGNTDRILGAHLLGPAAEETINLFALAMKHDLTAADIKSTLFVFPTFASDVRQML
ncbi:dihydrolipoyl dehydrogenase family protein [Roseimaritima ulvae]|uniref:Glutathione amide reductase n=1 Tax=Roseimaritima ulvae TaxID=980254 RepID=A0A5B9QYY0_9BACT|nr:NAD(P)/FAD-dependent oxidoreductase [Roseimaritima ulvae]QEG43159.1 Glutathione amide reductase [Roseimaritima ulvae]